MSANVKPYGRAKLVTPTQGAGGPGALATGESALALNPTLVKLATGEVEIYIPYDEAAGFARFARGDSATLLAASKLLAAAARFADGEAEPTEG